MCVINTLKPMKLLPRFLCIFCPENSRLLRFCLAGTLLSVSFAARAAEDPFAAGVRPTEPLSPEEQQKKFRLPPGFEIQLVAQEPDINKPFNLAFDAKGRLWVTTSLEYPWAAPTNRVGRDRLMIFEDFGPDGRARKVTQFADGLNIPIGIYPLTGARREIAGSASAKPETRNPKPETFGNAAIVWSIPNIWLMEDTDGDGKADRREVLYGPFDYTRDTHGNQASFRRGFDGWIYATHGFNNDSHVKGRDGHEVHLNSGNTYRFRIDGSRIEHHTHGQVNPFGLAWDPRGNLYSSDCHSAPTYQLLAGGYYPSFGKPHDGLGFAPVLMEHSHGSTAIDGMLYYADDLWPEEFRDNIFVGNVMTSRVNRDRLVFDGSSPRAVELEDFVRCDDPWFRPVDNQLGPDGAFYIADFYNRIIGHYEVPLTHPGRDRERGRIWRVIYKGAVNSERASDSSPSPLTGEWAGVRGEKTPGAAKDLGLRTASSGTPPSATRGLSTARIENGRRVRTLDLTTATADQLVNELADPNLTWRMLAMNQIEDRFGKSAASDVQEALRDPVNAFQHAHALWLLHRLNPPSPETGPTPKALSDAAKAKDPLVRIHAQRISADLLYQDGLPGISKHTDFVSSPYHVATEGLKDANALVQRCAAEALGNFRGSSPVRPLLALLHPVPEADTHLRYVIRKSIRNPLTQDGLFAEVAAAKWSDDDLRALADVAVAVKSERAGAFLNQQLAKLNFDRSTLTAILQHIARYAPISELDQLGGFVKSKFGEDVDFQLALFNGVTTGAEQRGAKLSEPLRAWGGELCSRALAASTDTGWFNAPLEGVPSGNPWSFQERRCADGQRTRLLSSLPNGEVLTGVLRSRTFALPSTLSFYLAGHDGFPERPAQQKNVVRLRLAPADVAADVSRRAGTQAGKIVAEAYAPRNDTAQRITWNLADHAGQPGFIEVTDADPGEAYAWIAFGRFDPPVLTLPSKAPVEIVKRQQTACDLAGRLKLASLTSELDRLTHEKAADGDARSSSAKALLALNSSSATPALAAALLDPGEPVAYRVRLGELLAEQKTPGALAAVTTAMKSAPYRSQLRWGVVLASSTPGAEALLSALASGAASPRLLQSIGIKNRIQAAKPENWQERVAKLTMNLPPADETRDKLIAERRSAYNAAGGKVTDGQRVFQQSCAVCHRIGNEGALVGPQLEGIGNRGLERLLEDLLDPNRNVDSAFRSHIITLKDGEVMSGLPRREEGELLVVADSTGKEISLPRKNIESRKESELSLMPENLAEIIAPADFSNLMAYLLAQRK